MFPCKSTHFQVEDLNHESAKLSYSLGVLWSFYPTWMAHVFVPLNKVTWIQLIPNALLGNQNNLCELRFGS